MKFTTMKLKDAYLIELDPIEDERGFFARSFCREEFAAQGIEMQVVQCNISYNKVKGTLRGMHYQKEPFQEAKLISCISGSVYDVLIDLRPESPSYLKWEAVALSAGNHQMLYIPKGFAHGFMTLENRTEVFYQMSEFYHPECAAGIRWNDPQINIQWPYQEPVIISKKDQEYNLLEEKAC